MGTDVSVALVMVDAAKAEALAAKIFARIAKYEAIFSRFKEESELSQLNRSGKMVVSEIFLGVLLRSLEVSALTNGAFNPLLQISKLGYQKDFSEMKSDIVQIDKKDSEYNTDLSLIKISKSTREVELASGQQLDFGGFLKGYLASLLVNEFTQKVKEIAGIIVNIGGDLATKGRDEFGNPFVFGIYNPIKDEDISVPVLEAALATSGTYKRNWETNLGQKHHIIDARTGDNPKTEIISASVISSDCGEAEALTKMLVGGGFAAAQTLPPETHYLLIDQQGNISTNLKL